MVRVPVRLIAVDIDGTLLNPQFSISDADLYAVRRAHEQGVEIIVVTGRRHTFALPIVQQLGFDLWVISSNGGVTRSLSGETFHRDMLPAQTCRELCGSMREFRGNTVLTFDKETKGALVLEHMNELNGSIQRWLEKNLSYIDFVVPIEDALTADPIQAMFCGPIARMRQALEVLSASKLAVTVLRTEYPVRDLSIVDVLKEGCSKGHALERWANYRGIAREQVMAIGDNYNDIEMLAFAGLPFIMGNASEELRRRNGWAVTLPNDQSGHFEKDFSVPPPATKREIPKNLDEIINTISDRHHLDPDLINSVIHAESAFNPRAVSPKGAQGLMQLMPGTASQLGVRNAFDPHDNVEGGTSYLRQLLEQYNFDLIKALAAYNAGPHRVQRYRGVPPYYETRAYVARIVREFNRKKLAEQKASSAAKNAQSKTKGHPRATVKQASVPETSQQVTR